jgi:hypothetical protein
MTIEVVLAGIVAFAISPALLADARCADAVLIEVLNPVKVAGCSVAPWEMHAEPV